MAIKDFPYHFSYKHLLVLVLKGEDYSWLFKVSDDVGLLYEIHWKPAKKEYKTLTVVKTASDTKQMQEIKQVFWSLYND
jgi:hypothetical protein